MFILALLTFNIYICKVFYVPLSCTTCMFMLMDSFNELTTTFIMNIVLFIEMAKSTIKLVQAMPPFMFDLIK